MLSVNPTVHIPLAGALASVGAFGGGLNVLAGYAWGNFSAAFSPGLFYYRNGNNVDEAIFTLGAVLRYTILRDFVIHPFAELGVDYVLQIGANGADASSLTHRAGGAGGSLAIGAEYDVTRNFSLQLAVRGSIIGGGDERSTTNPLVFDFMLTPFASLVFYR
jgi:outer membrane autotransporter protein